MAVCKPDAICSTDKILAIKVNEKIKYIQQNETEGADNNFFNIQFCQRNRQQQNSLRILKKFKSFGFFSQNSSKFFKICSKNSVRILEEVRIVGVECCGYLILPNVKKNIVEMKLHITLISTHCDPTTTLCLCVYQSNVRLSCP